MELYSKDYPQSFVRRPPRVEFDTVFDELVISDLIHIEQMDRRTWWLCIGNVDMMMIRVGKDGKPKMGEWYK